MSNCGLLLAGVFCWAPGSAQDSSPIIIKAGTSISEGIPSSDLYQYAQFSEGTVHFRSGTATNAKLNYNRFLDEIHFINPHGDTLTLDNEETIKMILISSDSFYYDKGFFMVVGSNGSIKLAIKQGFKVLDKQKTAAYGMPSSVSSIRNVNSYTTEGRVYKVAVAEDVVLSRETHYYFGNKYNQFFPANKKNLFELYPKYRYEIKNYLKETGTEFQNKDSLERLLQFLASY